jgi:hypothetical protein
LILPSLNKSRDEIYNSENDLCTILENLLGKNVLKWELPLEMRFQISKDDTLPYTENIAVLITSLNTGVDLEYTLFNFREGSDPDFHIYNFDYYCKLQMLGPWEGIKGNSSFVNALKKHFNFPNNMFCSKIFGRMLVAPEGYEFSGSCGHPIADWLIDYKTCKSSDKIFWNGTLSEFNETVQILSTPKLIYTSKSVKSNCTVALFAIGKKYLLNALLQTERFKTLQSKADESFCRQINIAIYSDEKTISLVEELEFNENVDYFYSIPEASVLSFPTDEEILNALSNSAQVMQHYPSLYWKRIFMFLHPPSPYMLYVDNEVFPCREGFDVIFEYLKAYDIVTYIEELQEYGNTYDEDRYILILFVYWIKILDGI